MIGEKVGTGCKGGWGAQLGQGAYWITSCQDYQKSALHPLPRTLTTSRGHESGVRGHSLDGLPLLELVPGARLGWGKQKLRLSPPLKDPALRPGCLWSWLCCWPAVRTPPWSQIPQVWKLQSRRKTKKFSHGGFWLSKTKDGQIPFSGFPCSKTSISFLT